MEFDYTDYESLTVCTEGCGEITDWRQSRIVADQAVKNHEKEKGHKCLVRERMKPEENL